MTGNRVIRRARMGSGAGLASAAAMTAMTLAFGALAQSPTGTDPRLEGVWVVTAAEKELDPYDDLKGAVVTFKGDTFTVERSGGRSKWAGHVKTDPKSGKIDLLNEADIFLPPLNGDKWEGLYRFNGPVLEINTTMAHDPRPAEFAGGYDITNIKLQKR